MGRLLQLSKALGLQHTLEGTHLNKRSYAIDHVLKDVGRVVVHVELGADERQQLRPEKFIIKIFYFCSN